MDCAITYAAVGTAFVEHAVTGVDHGIAADDLIWMAQETVGRGGCREIIRFGQCNHPDPGLLKWAIWEQPEGTLDDFQAHVGAHKLVIDFEVVEI